MELIIHNSSCVKNNLLCLGLSSIVKIIDNPHDLLDQLLKILLKENDGDNFTSKYNIALFIEMESAYLISNIADVEHTYATFKNVFRDFAKQDAPLFKGQCLVTMTTVLLRAFEMMNEDVLAVVFMEHLEFLLSLLKQTNNTSNVHVRSIAASCLSEIELCFPKILNNYLENIYKSAQAETSIAHQMYMALLALIMNHSLNEKARESALWGKNPCVQNISEEDDKGYSDVKEMVSFLVDHLPLCSTECTAWIATQIISMMVQRPDLQNSAQVLTPLVLHFSATYSTLNAYIVLLLEKELGSLIFQEKDKSQLLHHLILNSCHPSISPSIRLLYLDWLNNYLIREPEKKADIHNVAYLLPGSFDGSETLLRKLGLLSSILKNKEGSCRVLLHSLTILQKQLKCGSSIKLKSALIKILYKFLYDHGSEVATDIPRLLVAVTTEDVTFIPFDLNFIKCVQDTLPESHVPSSLLISLVITFTQPDSTATLATFHYVLDVFLVAIEQDMSICQPKAILNYMIKYVVCEEVCGLLSWSLGHKILSLCNRLMSNYDTIEFFYELCEVLKMFKSNCEDVDLLDRAHIYHSLLVSLSNKKLKQILVPPKQSLNSIMSNENTFHSTSSVCRLDKPVLQLTKESSSHLSKEKIIVETKQDIPEDILKLYTRHLSFVAQKPLILKGRLDTTSKVVSNMETFQALAIFFTVPESWGRIEPIMIGHFEKKGNEKPCVVDIECFLYKPYPAVIQVCAEFSIHHMYYICNLEPLSVELSDFFQPLPIHDDFICSPVLWRKSLFNCLWKHLEERSETVNNAAFTSVFVLHEPREDIMNKINGKLHNYIVEEFPDDNAFHIGIYLSPTNHLLMKLMSKESVTIVRIMTDDVNVLAYVNAYFKSW